MRVALLSPMRRGAAAVTGEQQYTLTVTDQVTGAVRTFESPGAFCGSADITLSAH